MNEKSTHKDNNEVRCSLCKSQARLVFTQCEGYIKGSFFDIFSCDSCNTQWAVPMDIDTPVYEWIYKNIAYVPGYSRYFDYQKVCDKMERPLSYLSQCEQSYWAVHKALRLVAKNTKRSSVRIIDVGCGLGYLTYAIKQEGFNVVGIDTSAKAVDAASFRYDACYECVSAADYAKKHPASFDLVILSQVIEHLCNPMEILIDAMRLTKKGGYVLVCVPNKGAFPLQSIWQTELPPVHLWWFSRRSIENLAAHINAEVHSLDTAAIGNPYMIQLTSSEGLTRPRNAPFFSTNGELLINAEKDTNNMRMHDRFSKLGIRNIALTLRKLTRALSSQIYFSEDTEQICVLLRNGCR